MSEEDETFPDGEAGSDSPGLPADERARRAEIARFSKDDLVRYMATNGEDFRTPEGFSALILVTTGRRSGRRILTPLFFREDAGRYILVGSYGGSPTHPDWYLNLRANPSAELQIGADRIAVRARTAEGDERARLWRLFPGYDAFQTRTDREIPVVILEPQRASGSGS